MERWDDQTKVALTSASGGDEHLRRVTILVPMFNEAEVIHLFVAALERTLPNLAVRWKIEFRLCFVDDGSRDDSVERLASYAQARLDIEIIKLSRNFGKEAAISAGLDHVADFDAVVIMDADLQHPPELIDTFLHHWIENEVDGVFAYKANREREGVLKSLFANTFYTMLNRGNRFEIKPNGGDFRLMSAKVVNALRELEETQRFMKGLYAWVGFRQVGVPFVPPPRPVGATNFSAGKLLLLSLDGITSFSVSPLRLMSLVGIGIAFLSFLFGIIVVFQKLFFGIPVPGLASTLAMIALFGGLQLVCLGIIGEYVGKTLMEAKRRPPYVIVSRVRHARSAVAMPAHSDTRSV